MTTLYYETSDELYHHGIKGMKWGVRRFQYKDGSLTSAGRKRYDDDPTNGSAKSATPKNDRSTKTNKSKHRQKLEQKYREQGLSQEQAEKAADKRIKTEKVIAVTAGLTIAAAGAYVAHKQIKYRADGVIKKSSEMKLISAEADKNLDRAFYSYTDKKDEAKYAGIFAGGLRDGEGAQPHKITLKADSDVKIVSRKKAEDTFLDLYKNDAEFRDSFHKINDARIAASDGKYSKAASVRKKVVKDGMTDKSLRKHGYDVFNIGLADHSDEGNAVAKKFYDKLKEQGYDAVMDVNDRKYSGYNSKKPVIVFNRENKLSVSNVEKLTNEYITENRDKAMSELFPSAKAKKRTEMIAKTLTTSAVAGAAGIKAHTSSKQSKAVAQYRKEHPETKLTDKQIKMFV